MTLSFQTKRVVFMSSQGSDLDDRLELPHTSPIAYALFERCFTYSEDYTAAPRVSCILAARCRYVSFDFTSLGNSEGDFADTNFLSNVPDVIYAADCLCEHHGAPKMLIGHSLGGIVALAAAQQVPECLVVAMIAAPSEPAHVIQDCVEQATEIEARGDTEMEIVGWPSKMRNQFLHDLDQYDKNSIITNLNRALLVSRSPADAIVGIAHSERIFQLARQPKSFLLLDKTDHRLSRQKDAEYVVGV